MLSYVYFKAIEMDKLYLKHSRSDPLYRLVVQVVLLKRINRVFDIQRYFRIGYVRATRFHDWMVAEHIIRDNEMQTHFRVVVKRKNKLKRYAPHLFKDAYVQRYSSSACR